MRVGIPCQPPGHALAAATPRTVARIIRLGYEVAVERGGGAAARIPHPAYKEAGALHTDQAGAWGADVVASTGAPGEAELDLMRPGATLISRLGPARSPELLEELRRRGLTALAIDAVPRISRAQAMDVLSSQANLAGYRAVIEAASRFGRLLGGQVTAAVKFPTDTFYVIGACVAWIAAIGTALSLGAVVRGSDVRPEVADQLKFVDLMQIQRPENYTGLASEIARAF